jgi:hypothetical protein
MSRSVVADEASRRAAEEARRQTLRGHLAARDAHTREREQRSGQHRALGPGQGVLAALAQAGVRLTHEQRLAIDKVLRAHPELKTLPCTPAGAAERLMAHGIHFTDAQLALVAEEGSISGLRRLESGFEARIEDVTPATARRRSAGLPVQTRTVLELAAPPRWRLWLLALKRWLKPSPPRARLVPRRS